MSTSEQPVSDFQAYPIWLWRPGFKDLGHQFPAMDAHVLRWLAGLAAQAPNPHFAEIGSFVGLTALILSEFAPVDCYDIWQETQSDDPINVPYRHHDVFSVFRQNVYEFPTKHPIRAKRVTVKFQSNDRPESVPYYDMVFIDGDHSQSAVLKDYDASMECLRRGGIVCGHDLGVFPGVTEACQIIKPDGFQGSIWWKFK